MKKENILKALIVIIGVGLTYIKYNVLEFINLRSDYLILIILTLIVVFFASILILNNKIYKLKFFQVNPNVKAFIANNTETEKLSKRNFSIGENTKAKITLNTEVVRMAVWIFSAFVISYVFGYYYKKPDAYMLSMALNKNAEWRKDLFLESLRAETDLFTLTTENTYQNGDFEFNWMAFTTTFLIIMLIYLIISKTTLVVLLKEKFKPFLK
ncbi:MAG: hypothetical protein V7655_06505 [Aequorivita antarctica]